MFCLKKRKPKNKFRTSKQSSLNEMFEAYVNLQQKVSTRTEEDYLPVHSLLETYYHQQGPPIPERRSSLTWWKTCPPQQEKTQTELDLRRRQMLGMDRGKRRGILFLSSSPSQSPSTSSSLKSQQCSEFLKC